MKLYVDEEDNGVFLLQTKCYNFIPVAEIKEGGEFIFTYEDDETSFLAALSDLLTWRGRFVKFTDDTNTYVYFTGVIVDAVEITPISVTFSGIQSIKILQDYPASYNPILASGEVKALDSLRMVDNWVKDFSTYNGKLLLVEDRDKFKCTVNIDNITLRNEADTGDFTPDYSGGDEDNTKWDSGIYYYNAGQTNGYYAAGSYCTSGCSNNRFFMKLDFKVPKRQATTFTKATLKLHFQTNRYASGVYDAVSGFPDYNERFKIFAFNNNTSAKDELFYDGDYTWSNAFGINNNGWEAVIPNIESNLHQINTITYEKEITSLLDFTDEYHFYNKTAYTDFDLYDFTIYLQVREPYAGISSERNEAIILYSAQLEVEYDLPNHIASGLAYIDTPSADDLNFSAVEHTAPYPQNVGWSTDDNYVITDNISASMANMWTASNADNILTLSMDTITDVGDTQDQTFTPLLRVIQLYSQMSQRLYVERNFTVYITNTLPSSTLQITEANIEGYPNTVKYSRGGGDNYTTLTVIGYAEQVYTLYLTEPISAQDKQKIIRNPDVYTSAMAESATNALQDYYEKDHVTLEFPVRLVNNTYKEKLQVGYTIEVYLQTGSFVDYRGANALLISKVGYYTDGTYDYANVTVTNKHEV